MIAATVTQPAETQDFRLGLHDDDDDDDAEQNDEREMQIRCHRQYGIWLKALGILVHGRGMAQHILARGSRATLMANRQMGTAS